MGIVIILFMLAVLVAGMGLVLEGFQWLLIFAAVLIVAALFAGGVGRVRQRV